MASQMLFQTDSMFCTDSSSAADLHEDLANLADADVLQPDNCKDTAEQEDTHTLEAVLQDSNPSHTIHPYLNPPDQVLSLAPAPENNSTVGAEMSHPDQCKFFVKHFPFGHAGCYITVGTFARLEQKSPIENVALKVWVLF